MSEPMTALEIEDVLSSIRRLVSEDLRPVTRPAAPASVEKLILTPALRVVVDVPPERPAPVAADALPASSGAMMRDEPAVSPPEDWAEEWEFEDEQDRAEPVWDDAVWDDAHPVAASVDPAPEWAGADEPAQIDPPDYGETGGPAPGWAQQSGLEAFLLIPSPVASRPDAPADPVWLDEAEAEVIATLTDEAAPAGAEGAGTGDAAATDAAEMTFEEAVLRDLVRDLIREELQGNLGERITRNIRKLVRAEIARAMALRDFD